MKDDLISKESFVPDQDRLSQYKVVLVPLTIQHKDDLAKACQDGELWKINNIWVPSPNTVVNYINETENTLDRVAFAVIDEATNKAIGSTSYYRISPKTKRLEIGFTWYAQSYWRTHVNTICKLMLLTHAFEILGYHTVGWRTDTNNFQSQRAIERLGAKRDGVIRGDRVRQDGVITDSVIYSMTKSEWLTAKTRLQEKLSNYY